MILFLMSSHELPFGLIREEETIDLLLLDDSLLLLRYVLVVRHVTQLIHTCHSS